MSVLIPELTAERIRSEASQDAPSRGRCFSLFSFCLPPCVHRTASQLSRRAVAITPFSALVSSGAPIMGAPELSALVLNGLRRDWHTLRP